MIISAIAFYLFAAITIISGFMVVTARNPVHSVLWLILAFFNSAGLFVLMGAEFLAMVLVVVYVGAVAVLFLFVVMMLDVNFQSLRQGAQNYAMIGGIIGTILLIELIFLMTGNIVLPEGPAGAQPIPAFDMMSNTHALGHVLYTDYFYLFQAAGMILLVAMVGAIVLTLRERAGVRKQKVADQMERRPADTLAVVKVQPGQGA
ncbi:MAG TPA: NADH-quinone oxidoreductase subunit J [Alphaproteobacteria bacterium]|nr:NADH-quinone oxidoreductase subunit J [Alphaproteobacteria bacterium]